MGVLNDKIKSLKEFKLLHKKMKIIKFNLIKTIYKKRHDKNHRNTFTRTKRY